MVEAGPGRNESTNNASLSAKSLPPSEPGRSVDGQVVAFVSAKGGTGKTLLSASAAYLLTRAKRRVVIIDTDFSTRGVSLYVLGDILESSDLQIMPNQCLADALIDGLKPDEVMPRKIHGKYGEFIIVLSNAGLWRGGVEEDSFFMPHASTGPDLVPRYIELLHGLCAKLRKEFDHIIIDTRGGYDFSSAVPAIVADGYVLVLEADRISLNQVSNFLENIGKFFQKYASRLSRKPSLKGCIVNKATFPVDDKEFPRALLQLYSAKTFGIIPLDMNAMAAYQSYDLPLVTSPGSEFSQYTLETMTKLFNPEQNWPKDDAKRFEAEARTIRIPSKWRVVRSSSTVATQLLRAVLLVAMLVCYFIVASNAALPLWTWILGGAALGLWSLIPEIGAALAKRPVLRTVRFLRVAFIAGTAILFCVWLVAMLIFAPATFASQIASKNDLDAAQANAARLEAEKFELEQAAANHSSGPKGEKPNGSTKPP